jgi:chemotaxis signal transduction protein
MLKAESLIPFQVGSATFAIAHQSVRKISLPISICKVPRNSSTPLSVVGVIASENALLTVVDAGRMFGQDCGPISDKSRLFIFSDGPMHGYSMLVSRVWNLCPRDQFEAGNPGALIDIDFILNAINKSVKV